MMGVTQHNIAAVSFNLCLGITHYIMRTHGSLCTHARTAPCAHTQAICATLICALFPRPIGSAPSMSPRHTLSSQGSSSIPGLPAIELSSSQRTSAATGMPARPSQVYSVDTALNTPLPPLPSPSQSSKRNSIQGGGTPSGQRLKGLDILEELEALELQRHNAALAYDSDEEFKAFGRHTQAQAQPDIVVTNATGLVGLTKGVRLPDAILVPSEDADKTDD